MITIYAYPLQEKDELVVDIRGLRKVLSVVGDRNGRIFLYALVDTNGEEHTDVRIHIFSVGKAAPRQILTSNMEFLGSIVPVGVGPILHIFREFNCTDQY